jgi:DNA-binding GntR family transcriptional regulator
MADGREACSRPKHPAERRSSVSDRTYEELLGRILSRQLAPGEIIEEGKLAQSFKVSRTPLRDAVSRLRGEGMVARRSDGATAVREMSVTEFLEVLQVRRCLESEAAALAAGRVPPAKINEMRRGLQAVLKKARAQKEEHWLLDDALHDLIADYSGNAVLAHIIRSLRRRARLCNIERVPGRLVSACEEHLDLLAALASGDPEHARDAMIRHLKNVRRHFLNTLDREQDLERG